MDADALRARAIRRAYGVPGMRGRRRVLAEAWCATIERCLRDLSRWRDGG